MRVFRLVTNTRIEKEILNKAGVSLDALTIKAQRELEKLPRVTGDVEPRLTNRLVAGRQVPVTRAEAPQQKHNWAEMDSPSRPCW